MRRLGFLLACLVALISCQSNPDLEGEKARLLETVSDAEGKQEKTYGHYISIWKKQPDGSWKFVFDTGNENPAINKF